MVSYRTCTKCGTEREETTEMFGKDKKSIGGLRTICRNCYSIQQSEYYKNKRDKILLDKHQYYLINKERILESTKQYQEVNKDKIYVYSKRYRKDNRDLFNTHHQKRRTKMNSLISNFTANQWVQLKKDFDSKCAYCGKTKPLAQDHFVPVIKGGEYTIDNIIPTCRSCNSSKGSKDFFKWYLVYEHYSKEREAFILKVLKCNKHNQLTSAL